MTLIRTLILAFAFCWGGATAVSAEPALFEISDEDTSIYLLGTVHLLPQGSQWRSEAIEEALARAGTLYLEANVYDASPATSQRLIGEYGVLPFGETLSDHLSRDQWSSVLTYARDLGLPQTALNAMQPWFAAVTLTTVAAMQEGYNPGAGVDAALHADWADRAEDRRYFETYEEQLSFLADMPMEIQVQFLMESVIGGEGEMDVLEQLIAAWLAGDMALIDSLANGSMRDAFPEVHEALIVRRNVKWAEELSGVMQTPGVVFVAVGAAHMPGDQGILNLMEDAGYRVSRH